MKSEAGAVELLVKDSGIGMSKETIEQLFKKFSRGDATQQGKLQGTGLGLYVAKRIVSAHKGELWAESEGEGRGSIFHFKLAMKNFEAIAEKSLPNDVDIPKAA
jgi:two-component system sensor histidine kinase VicK